MALMEEEIIPYLPSTQGTSTDEIWSELTVRFKAAYERKEIVELDRVIMDMRTLVQSNISLITAENNAGLVEPMFNLITEYPFLNFQTQSMAAMLFPDLFGYEYKRPKNVHLSLQKTLVFHRLLFQPKNNGAMPPAKGTNAFLEFFLTVKNFFDEKDGEELIRLFKDEFCIKDSKSNYAFCTMCKFMPPCCLPKFMEFYLYTLENPTYSITRNAIFYIIAGAIKDRPITYDFLPHLDLIFNGIIRSLNPKTKVNGIELELDPESVQEFGYVGAGFNNKAVASYCGNLISIMLVEGQLGDAVLNHLKQLFDILIPTIGPKRSNNKLLNLFCGLSEGIKMRYITRAGNERAGIPNNFPTQDQIDRFVEILIPYLNKVLFASNMSTARKICDNIHIIIDLSPQIFFDEFLHYTIEHFQDPEMTDHSIICATLLNQIIPHLMNTEQLKNNMKIIYQLLEQLFESMKEFNEKGNSMAIRIVANICSHIYVTKPTNDMEMIKRNICDIIISNFMVYSKCLLRSIEFDQMDNKLQGYGKKAKHINYGNFVEIDSHWGCYYACLDPSIIEQHIPDLIDIFSETKPYCGREVIHTICYVQSSLVTKFFDVLSEKFLKASELKKKYYAVLLAAIQVGCEQIIPIIPKILSLAKSQFETKSLKDMKIGYWLICQIPTMISNYYIIDWRLTPHDENPINNWGRKFLISQLKPQFYKLPNDICCEAINGIFGILRPLLEQFNNLELKLQKLIITIIISMDYIFCANGSLTTKITELEPVYKERLREIYEFARELVKNGNQYQKKAGIRIMQSYKLIHSDKTDISDSVIGKLINNYSGQHSYKNMPNMLTRFAFLNYILVLQNKSIYTGYSFVDYEDYSANVYALFEGGCFLCDILKTAIDAHHYLNFSAIKGNQQLLEDIYSKVTEMYKNSTKKDQHETEAYLGFKIMYAISNNNNVHFYLTNVIRDIVSLQIQKDWEKSGFINQIINIIESKRILSCVQESSHWRSLLNDILDIPRTIGQQQFHFLIRFITYQTPMITPEIAKFIVDEVQNPSTPGLLKLWETLIHLLFRIKHRANYEIIKGEGTFFSKDCPYIDNTPRGFYCDPAEIKNFEDIEEHEDELSPLRNVLIENLDIAKLMNIAYLMHTEDANSPEFIPNHVILFRNLASVLRARIIPQLRELLSEYFDKSLVHMFVAFEVLAGVNGGTRHWAKADKEQIINEIYKPFFSKMVEEKILESQSSELQSYLAYFVGDQDFRRNIWLIDFMKHYLKSENRLYIRNIIFSFSSMLIEMMNVRFHNEVGDLILNYVLPAITPLTEISLNEIHVLGQFIREIIDKCYSPRPEVNYDWVGQFFDILIEKNIEIAPGKLMNLFDKIFYNNLNGFRFAIPVITKHFERLVLVRNKMEMNEEVFCNHVHSYIGLLDWHMYPQELDKVLKLISTMMGNQWFICQNLIGFLHSLCFNHLFILKQEVYHYIYNELLPVFLVHEKDEVQVSALELERLILNLIFTTDEKLEEFALKIVTDMSKKDNNLAVARACSLINYVIIGRKCPSWLPEVFFAIDTAYQKRHPYKKNIEKSAVTFWTKHQYHDLPELEDYRYAFTGSYYQ